MINRAAKCETDLASSDHIRRFGASDLILAAIWFAGPTSFKMCPVIASNSFGCSAWPFDRFSAVGGSLLLDELDWLNEAITFDHLPDFIWQLVYDRCFDVNVERPGLLQNERSVYRYMALVIYNNRLDILIVVTAMLMMFQNSQHRPFLF
jgi:hypothetical protein